MKLVYFAWVRERIGTASEEVSTGARTVAELVEDLRRRSPGHALAFADISALRVAVDEEVSDFSAPIEGAREVAFFPPMTGG
ncbi:MAG: molybdopterin converting factor subunit 1 [Alphaproteobacteria bacterium]|nr:MAG: molybdopterin converting factor subunit 1 [Alphaproteobacteria bacterium]